MKDQKQSSHAFTQDSALKIFYSGCGHEFREAKLPRSVASAFLSARLAFARPAAARPGFLSEGRSPVTLPGNLFNF